MGKEEQRSRKTTKYLSVPTMLTLSILVLVVSLVRGCYHLLSNAEEEVFTSPGGTNTIVVRYDLVCRPTIYQKRVLWNKEIWNYPNSGFMETVHFNVEWLSETEIRFTYDDVRDKYEEEYFIRIPE